MMSIASLNMQRLSKVVGLDPADLVELLELFFATAPDLVAAIRSATDNGDWEAARAAAHKLRGGAATVGLTDLAQEVSRVHEKCGEAMGRGLPADTAGLDDSVQALHNCVRRFQSAYAATLDESA